MIRKKIAAALARKKFISRMLEEPADLSAFRERPTPRLIAGLALMAFSYVIGWPAVAVLGVLAALYGEPMIVVIGGPAIYAFSYVVFIIGAWLARAPRYLGILTKYTLQVFLRKLLS